MTEVLLDRCRPGHMCPEAEEKWALVDEAREAYVLHGTGEARTRAYLTEQDFRVHQSDCMGNCRVCMGGGYLLKGETLDVECWRCKGRGGR